MVTVRVTRGAPRRSGGGSSRTRSGGGAVRVTVVDNTSSSSSRTRTLETLKKEQEVEKIAEVSGGLTRLQFQRELRRRGVSVRELRRATREASARMRSGDNIFEEARQETKDFQAKAVVSRQQTRNMTAANMSFADRGREIVGRTRQMGEVQPAPKRGFFQRVKDLPSKAIERVTGRKPKEIFFEATGSERTVVDKVTPLVITSEIAQVPRRLASGVGETGQILAERGAKKVVPEGIKIEMRGQETRNITFFEPQFGTVTQEQKSGIIKRTVEDVGRPTRTVTIFEPKRIGQGVSFGTQLGTALAFPTTFAVSGVAEGSETALNKEKTKTQRALGVAEVAVSAGFLGFQAGRLAKTPITKTITLRKAKEPIETSVKISRKVQTPMGEKVLTTRTSVLRGEIGDRVKVVETTRVRDLFGFKPKKVKVIEPKKFSIETPTAQMGEQPFFVEEFVEGKKFTTLLKVTPSQAKPISASTFKRLPAKEKFLVQRLLERKIGRPISSERVPQLIKDKNIIITESEVKEFARISQQGQTLLAKPIKPGKRTQRFLTASEEFSAGTEDLAQISSSLSVSKDITKPLSRAAGKTPSVKSFTLNIGSRPGRPKEIPDLFSQGEGALTPAKIKKTPMSSTFSRQEVQQTQSALLSSLRSRIKPRRIPKAKTITTKRTIIERIPASVFAGKGVFEKQPVLSTSRIRTQTTEATMLSTKPEVSLSQKNFLVSQIGLTDTTQTNFKLGEDVGTSTQTQQGSRLGLSSASVLSLSQQITQTQGSPSTTTQTTITKPNIIIVPTTQKSAVKEKTKKGFVKKKLLGYIPEVKEKGEWIRASKKVHTRAEALRIAKRVADNTTAVTIRAKKTSKKPIKPKSKRKFVPTKFRDYKLVKGKRVSLPKNTFIEKKTHRIDTSGEKRKLTALAFLGKKRSTKKRSRRRII